MIDEQEAKKTHPGFTIICDACGSKVVIVDDTLGFSATSGAWGDVSLICQDCHASCELTACKAILLVHVNCAAFLMSSCTLSRGIAA